MENLDLKTVEFLISLRARNYFWYHALMQCAKSSPKIGIKCLNELKAHLSWVSVDIKDLNIFEICQFANSEEIDIRFMNAVSGNAFELYRQTVANRIKADGLFSNK